MRRSIIPCLFVISSLASAQTNSTLEVASAACGISASTATPVPQMNAGKVTGKVSPELYGPPNLSIESADGKTAFASAKVSNISGKWKKDEATLKTGNVQSLKENRFVVMTTKPKQGHGSQTEGELI